MRSPSPLNHLPEAEDLRRVAPRVEPDPEPASRSRNFPFRHELLHDVTLVLRDPKLPQRELHVRVVGLVGVEVHRDEDGIVPGPFTVEEYVVVRGRIEREVLQILERGVLVPDLVYPLYVLLDVSRTVPVPDLVLVHLGILVVYGGTRLAPRGVLAQLEAAVYTVGTRQRGREHEPHLECGAAAELEDVRQDVVGVGEEVGAHVLLRPVLRKFRQVLYDLLLVVAPRKVRVGLGEAKFGQGLHHLRSGEGFGEEDHPRVLLLYLPDHPLPERERFGMGIVPPEDPDSLLDPEQDHTEPLPPQVLPVLRVEVQVDDVLVLLRRVLCVLYGPVRPEVEPLRMLLDIRVIRRALDGEVKRDLHPVLVA